MILPSTYEVSGELLCAATKPIAFGGFGDVYKGYLGLESVCIKRLRISVTGDLALVKRVLHPQNLQPEHVLMSFEVTLQGGCAVETPQSSQHCALQGCHFRTPPTRVKMDALWRVEGIYKKYSSPKSNYTCKSV